MKCSACGKRVHERFSRCPYCGSDLISHAAPAPAGTMPGQPAFTAIQPEHPAAANTAPPQAPAAQPGAPAHTPPPAVGAAIPPGAPPQGTAPAWHNAGAGFVPVTAATPPSAGGATPVTNTPPGAPAATPERPPSAAATSFAPVTQAAATPPVAVPDSAATPAATPEADSAQQTDIVITTPGTPDAPAADAPEEPVYKEITVGPKSRPEKPEKEKEPESTAPPAEKIRTASPSSVAGYLWLFAGILLSLTYLNYFQSDLSTFLLSYSMQESFSEYVAANLSTLLDYTLLFTVHLLAIVTGVLLALSGRATIQRGSGIKPVKVCFVFQIIILLNYLVRWIIYFATYYTAPSTSVVMSVTYNLLLEALLIFQVFIGLRLQANKR